MWLRRNGEMVLHRYRGIFNVNVWILNVLLHFSKDSFILKYDTAPLGKRIRTFRGT